MAPHEFSSLLRHFPCCRQRHVLPPLPPERAPASQCSRQDAGLRSPAVSHADLDDRSVPVLERRVRAGRLALGAWERDSHDRLRELKKQSGGKSMCTDDDSNKDSKFTEFSQCRMSCRRQPASSTTRQGRTHVTKKKKKTKAQVGY